MNGDRDTFGDIECLAEQMRLLEQAGALTSPATSVHERIMALCDRIGGDVRTQVIARLDDTEHPLPTITADPATLRGAALLVDAVDDLHVAGAMTVEELRACAARLDALIGIAGGIEAQRRRLAHMAVARGDAAILDESSMSLGFKYSTLEALELEGITTPRGILKLEPGQILQLKPKYNRLAEVRTRLYAAGYHLLEDELWTPDQDGASVTTL